MANDEDQKILTEEIREEIEEDAKALSEDDKSQAKRLLMKDWLIQKLDVNDMPEVLSWINKAEGLFRIKWLHKATDSWEVLADAALFKEWCIHTGKYDPSNENPRRWKANFRCALNSLPDVILVPQLCVRKGKDAFRVFRILPEKIPEKVREKIESSRKRRRELKAILKMELSGDDGSKSMPKRSKTTSTGKRGSGNKGSLPLNGMDALCTAAALMANKPSVEEDGGEEPKPIVITSAGPEEAVTYYLPTTTNIISQPVSPTVVVSGGGQRLPVVTSIQTSGGGIPVFRPVPNNLAPLRGILAPHGTPGNILVNLRLANPPGGLQTAQCLTIPQLQSLGQGICLQQVGSGTSVQGLPYLIHKRMVPKQAVVSQAQGQQPRVFTCKPASTLITSSSSARSIAGSSISSHAAASNTASVLASTLGSHHGNLQENLQPMSAALSIEYSQLRANLTVLDYDNLGFQACKNSMLIQLVRFYETERASVEVCLTVKSDFSFTIYVHNKALPEDHQIIQDSGDKIRTISQLTAVLQRLNDYVTCIGNLEELYHQQYSDYSAFCSAYHEPDMGAKCLNLRYFSTIRSYECRLLIKKPTDVVAMCSDEAKRKFRCEECSKISGQVLSMKGLFSLLDSDKIPETDSIRSKRLDLLKQHTTKEVLVNRIEVLESHIRALKKLPAGTFQQLAEHEIPSTMKFSPSPNIPLLNSQSGDCKQARFDDENSKLSVEGSDIVMDSDELPSTEKLLEELSSSPTMPVVSRQPVTGLANIVTNMTTNFHHLLN